MACPLLIVCRKMLHGGHHSLLLHAQDILHRCFPCQIWILSEILEVAPAHGSAVDVDTGTEEDADAAGAAIIGKAVTETMCQITVPGGGGEDAAGV